MAEREVLFKLMVKGNEETARGIKQPGDAAEKTAKQMDGLTAAERRLEQQQRQMNQATGQMVGGGVGLPGGASFNTGGSRAASPQQSFASGVGAGGVQLPGSFKAFLGLSAASAGARGFGQGIGELAGSDGGASFGQAFGKVTAKMLEGVPIIGGMFTGLADFSNAISGATSAIEANKRALETSMRMIGTERGVGDVRFAGSQAIMSAGSGHRDAASAAAAQAAAMGRLTPGALASFRPTDIFGNQDAGLGSANLGVFNAQTALDVAQRQAANRQSELADTQSSFNPNLDGRISNQRTAATAAQGRVGKAKTAVDQQLWIIHKSAEDVALSDAQTNAAQQQAKLADLLLDKQREANALKERQAAVDQANVRVAQAQLDLAKQQLEVERSKLTAKDEQIGRSKSGAVALGMGAPGESDALLATVRQLQQSGFGSLSQEQKSQLSSNPLTSALVQQQAQQAGLNDPNNAAIRGLVGQISPNLAMPDLSILERERQQIVDAISVKMVENERAFQTAVGDALGKGLGRITDAFQTVIEAKVEEMRVRILADINRGNIQGRP